MQELVILPDAGVQDNCAPSPKIIADLNHARALVDRATDLLEVAENLRQRIYWGLDLDDIEDDVRVFRYACKAHRWWRRT
jgi:hypothetical protein